MTTTPNYAILDEPLGPDDFPTRCLQQFEKGGIKTWRDLATQSEQDMLPFGANHRKHAREVLARHGLSFGMNDLPSASVAPAPQELPDVADEVGTPEAEVSVAEPEVKPYKYRITNLDWEDALATLNLGIRNRSLTDETKLFVNGSASDESGLATVSFKVAVSPVAFARWLVTTLENASGRAPLEGVLERPGSTLRVVLYLYCFDQGSITFFISGRISL